MTSRAASTADRAAVLAGVRFLRTFDGTEPTPGILTAIREGRATGVTLFRHRNIGSPAQVRELSARLQAARPEGSPPLLIGLDQEGGQLQAVGDGATGWPGNLALGATRSPELAARFGRALGVEAAAMGATLVFAPVCDLLSADSATPLGTRPFGSDPDLAGKLAAAVVLGIQESGVAAVLKHFPGHGRAQGDSHHATPVVRASLASLRAHELRPFTAGIAAGAAAVLPGHLAVPVLTGGDHIPATVSRAILEDLLRDELGFAGITVSDAMDMGGAGGAERLGEVLVAAADAGMDVLLMAHGEAVEDAAFDAFVAAIRAGSLDAGRLERAEARVITARRALAGDAIRPPLDLVGCAEHRALAAEIAREAVTLVRDPRSVLPLRPGGRVALVAPVPVDLTPAETSSYLRLSLPQALRDRGVEVDELVMPLNPSPAEGSAIAAAIAGHETAILCLYDAVSFAGQAALVHRVLAAAATDRPTVVIALRTPYDVALVPEDVAVACSYGIQTPTMEALADALIGQIPFAGTLPVELNGAGGGGEG